eukprot:m.70528 g.70528  ORF g.70528 m.70528 type:complete len:934 (-) comp7598_c2_seq1:212-3013(-)
MTALREMNGTASASWKPLPIMQYDGAFSCSPATVTPQTADALIMLAQYGYNATNIDCGPGACTFTSLTRHAASQPAIARRSVPTRAEITNLYIAPQPVPYLKRLLTIIFPADRIDAQEVSLFAIQIIQLQPIDISCTPTMCRIQTYDPVQPSDMQKIASALPAGSILAPLVYYSKTELSLPNPKPADINGTTVRLLAVQQGISPLDAACNETSCTLWTYSIARQAQLARLGALANATVSVSFLNESASVNLPDGWYYATVSIRADAHSPDTVLQSASIRYSNLSCPGSLVFDNTLDCSYFTPHELNPFQAFNLYNFVDDVVTFDVGQPLTLGLVFSASLQRTLTDLVGFRQGRVQVTSFDSSTGLAVVNVGPIFVNDSNIYGANTTMWTASYNSVMDAISLANATAVLVQAGVAPASVDVNGPSVTFTSRSITASNLALIRADPLVDPSSVSTPVPAQSAMTHEEMAQLIVFSADNNMLTVPVADRTFWAIPSSASSTTRPIAPASASSSGDSTSFMVIGIVIAAILAVVIIALLVHRSRVRHANKMEQNALKIMSSGEGPSVFHCDNPAFQSAPPGTLDNPMYGMGQEMVPGSTYDAHVLPYDKLFMTQSLAAGQGYSALEQRNNPGYDTLRNLNGDALTLSADGTMYETSQDHIPTMHELGPGAAGQSYFEVTGDPAAATYKTYLAGTSSTDPMEGSYAFATDRSYGDFSKYHILQADSKGDYQMIQPIVAGEATYPSIRAGSHSGYMPFPAAGSNYTQIPGQTDALEASYLQVPSGAYMASASYFGTDRDGHSDVPIPGKYFGTDGDVPMPGNLTSNGDYIAGDYLANADYHDGGDRLVNGGYVPGEQLANTGYIAGDQLANTGYIAGDHLVDSDYHAGDAQLANAEYQHPNATAAYQAPEPAYGPAYELAADRPLDDDAAGVYKGFSES